MRYDIQTEDGRVYILSPAERKILDMDGHTVVDYVGDVFPEVGYNLFVQAFPGEQGLVTAPVVNVTEHHDA